MSLLLIEQLNSTDLKNGCKYVKLHNFIIQYKILV